MKLTLFITTCVPPIMTHNDTTTFEALWGPNYAHMEKDQIFPQTRFVNNQYFRKKCISTLLTITRIIVEIIINRL